MIRYQAYKYELKPTKAQINHLRKACGVARFTYNWGLAKMFELLEKKEQAPSIFTLTNLLNSIKKDQFPWMYEVSKCASQEALRDLGNAKNRWYKKQNRKPQFKKRGRSRDSYRVRGSIRVTTKHVQIPRLGKVRIKGTTAGCKGSILTATII